MIAVDAMGGDYGPSEVCLGTVEACEKNDALDVALIGDQPTLEACLEKCGEKYSSSVKNRIHIVHSEEVVSASLSPTKEIRFKRKSSMRLTMEMVRSGEAQGCVSCGSTGAIVAGGVLLVGRMKGIDRPGLGVILPTQKNTLLLDAGATIRCKPMNLVQFALMGSIYMRDIMKVGDRPKICLLSNGSEEAKGDEVIITARDRLRQTDRINFGGYVEANRVPLGDTDVVVCDGFSGNVMLKSFEGLIKFEKNVIKEALSSSVLGKLGALMLYPALSKLAKRVDYQSYGGAALLGVNGAVVKAHGRSKAPAITNAISVAYNFVQSGSLDKIREDVQNEIAASSEVYKD